MFGRDGHISMKHVTNGHLRELSQRLLTRRRQGTLSTKRIKEICIFQTDAAACL